MPVFIIGSPRSGTTMLARALAQHSHFWGSGESNILYSLYGNGQIEAALERLRGRSSYSWMRQEGVTEDTLLSHLGLGINSLFSSRSGGRRWIEKTPINTLMADALAAMFPDALFIHILRDGRDVVASMERFFQAHSPERQQEMVGQGRIPRWAADFAASCRTWRRYVEAASDFAARVPDRAYTVRYERLAAEPVAELTGLFAFLGVPGEAPPSEFIRSRRVNSSFSRSRSRPEEPVWTSWSPQQRLTFWETAGTTMEQSGYNEAREDTVRGADPLAKDIRAAVRNSVPAGASVGILGGGNLDIPDVAAIPFPAGPSGEYLDRYPATGAHARALLEAACLSGVEYLLIPRGFGWWLADYPQFASYLVTDAQILIADSTFVLADLTQPSRSMEDLNLLLDAAGMEREVGP
jgi:hypothetical protein